MDATGAPALVVDGSELAMVARPSPVPAAADTSVVETGNEEVMVSPTNDSECHLPRRQSIENVKGAQSTH